MTATPIRVLVTGAGGFVGTWLLARLGEVLPAGATVVPVTSAAAETDAVVVDIIDAAAVDDLVRTQRPTAIVHLAAISSPVEARQSAHRAWAVNFQGTMNLAESVLRHAPEARFLFAGSSEAYGASFNAAGGILDESAALNPLNVYAATKAAADLLLGQMAEDGLQAVRFRPFNHTGPGQSDRFVVPAFAAQIAAIERGEREPVMRVGNLEAKRDFLDVRDVVAAYALAITAPSLPRGLILNLASGQPRRIGDVLDTLLGMSAARIAVVLDPALMRPSDIPLTGGSRQRAEQLLGWHPAVDWQTTLSDVLDTCRRAKAS